MSYYITVPYRSQLAGPDGPDEDDLTGCWYACAQMLGLYYDGNLERIGVPELDSNYYKKMGLTPPRSGHGPLGGQKFHGEDAEAIFEKNEHLSQVPFNPTSWTIANLEVVLRNSGPIIYFWFKPDADPTFAYGHACVIVGTETEGGFRDVIYHDPGGSANSRMSFTQFMALKEPVPMLVRSPGKNGKILRHLEYRKKTVAS